MASIDITAAAEAIPVIVAAKTLGRLSSNLVLAGLVNRDYDVEIAQFGDTVNVPIRGALTVATKSAATDLTPQGPTHTKAQVLLDQHKAVPIQADDIAIMQARPSFIDGYAEDAAIALAENVESALGGLYSGFSQSIDATTGLDEDDFRNARRLLNSAKAPMTNRYAVLHEDADYEALGIEQVTNRDYTEALGQAQANSFVGRFMGFDLHMSQNVTATGGEAKNLFFQRDAMMLVSRPMRVTNSPNVMQATMMENNISLRVTLTYNALGLAEVMIIDMLYGFAELRDLFGITVRTTEI